MGPVGRTRQSFGIRTGGDVGQAWMDVLFVSMHEISARVHDSRYVRDFDHAILVISLELDLVHA